MSKIKVCHISTVHQLFDPRIFYKECRDLSDSGFDVYLIVTHAHDEIIDGINIIHLPKWNSRIKRFFINGFFALKKALQLNAVIYHFHDPELMLAGVILKLFRKKVIYDVHEYIPEQIYNKEYLRFLWIKHLISNIYRLIIKLFCLFYDGIVTVTPMICNNFPKKKTILLRNFVKINYLENINPIEIKKDKPVVIYAGGLTPLRGIKQLLMAVGKLNGKVELWLLGRWSDKNFKDECCKLSGWKFTKYIGHLKLNYVYEYMRASDIGVHIIHPVNNYSKGIYPTKVFEYFACSLPVILSRTNNFEKVFNQRVLFTDPYDADEISQKIELLISDNKLRKELTVKGYEMVKSGFNWENEFNKLTLLYNKII